MPSGTLVISIPPLPEVDDQSFGFVLHEGGPISEIIFRCADCNNPTKADLFYMNNIQGVLAPPPNLSDNQPQPTVPPVSDSQPQPTAAPSNNPTASPSDQPTPSPSVQPSVSPSSQPSAAPSHNPTASPSGQPSSSPSSQPSSSPSSQPSSSPSVQPSASPSTAPSVHPSTAPSVQPSSTPSLSPSDQPSQSPSSTPSSAPTRIFVRILPYTKSVKVSVDIWRNMTASWTILSIPPPMVSCADLVVDCFRRPRIMDVSHLLEGFRVILIPCCPLNQ